MIDGSLIVGCIILFVDESPTVIAEEFMKGKELTNNPVELIVRPGPDTVTVFDTTVPLDTTFATCNVDI